MNLLVIRHAIAMEREDFASVGGTDDDLRPLTEAGARKMRRIAPGIRQFVERIDLLATSPLTRAAQTAQIVAECYGISVGRTVDALRPENAPEAFATWAKGESFGDVCAIVGHEPQLGRLVTWLLTGTDDSRVAMKKGGACLISFAGMPGHGEGVLKWLLTPSQLIECG